MNYEGVLTKMQSEFQNPIQYFLIFKNDFIHMNQLIGASIKIDWMGEQCLSCGFHRDIFRQGFCKSCFFEKPIAGEWILKPELSQAHLNIEDRDLEFEKEMQLQPHIVYLANSSNLKVGVTRKKQIPTRWIDQGAHEALEILETPNRYLAGISEVALKEHVSDKTNWRSMLKNDVKDVDLPKVRDELKRYIPDEVESYFLPERTELHLHFPVQKYPNKPRSLNLKKDRKFSGKLVGIKGQYLIFDDDTVFNVRSNEGTIVNLSLVPV
jgi:hypothetical protein